MPPRETIWPLAQHTGAKHSILRRYLGAWFPKLAWARRLVFIDGFAGPGEYVGGAPGSPIIALDAAATHRANLADCELIFVFLEEDKARYEHLNALIQEKMPLPVNIKVRVSRGTFLDDVDGLLKPIEEGNQQPCASACND